MKVIFLSSNTHLCDLWKFHLADFNHVNKFHSPRLFVDVQVINSELYELKLNMKDGSTCFVAPANSYGSMGGGYDLALTRFFGPALLESMVKQKLRDKFNGYLPSKSPELLEVYDKSSLAWKSCRGRYVMVIPTMDVPKKLHFATYLDTHKFIFDICWNAFSSLKKDKIKTLVLTGVGAGFGGIDLAIVAKSMVYALVIYYNTSLTPLMKSLYVMRYLQTPEMMKELGFSNKEIADNNIRWFIERARQKYDLHEGGFEDFFSIN